MRKRVSYVWPRWFLRDTTIALLVALALQLHESVLRVCMWAVVVAWLTAVCAIVWNAVAAAEQEADA